MIPTRYVPYLDRSIEHAGEPRKRSEFRPITLPHVMIASDPDNILLATFFKTTLDQKI
jgi:hypothetical protein